MPRVHDNRSLVLAGTGSAGGLTALVAWALRADGGARTTAGGFVDPTGRYRETACCAEKEPA